MGPGPGGSGSMKHRGDVEAQPLACTFAGILLQLQAYQRPDAPKRVR